VDAIDRRIDQELVGEERVELPEVALEERLSGPLLELYDACLPTGSSA